MRWYLTIFISFLLVFTNEAFSSFAGRGLNVETFKGYSRVTIPVKPNSSFEVNGFDSSASSLKISIENMHEAYWTQSNRLSDKMIRDVRSRATGKKGIIVDIGIRSTYSEHFVYYQPNPPSVIVDIWKDQKSGKERVGKRKDSLQKSLPQSVKKPPSAKRKVASKRANDAEINKTTPLSFDNDLFFDLPIITPEFTYKGKNFSTSTGRDPGAGWQWSEPDLKLEGGTNFSLAIKLYKRKQYSLAIRAVEYARRDHPNSIYLDELEFLEALSYRKLGLSSNEKSLVYKAREQFKELMLRQKDGKNLRFSQKLRIYFASRAYREKRWLDAISHFEFIIGEKSKDEPDLPGVLLANAESYFKLRQYRRAARVYRSAHFKYKTSWLGKESKYRLANTLAMERKYKKADLAFRAALSLYPKYEKKRSEAYFNLAEVNFRMKKLNDARYFFKKYIKNHSSQTHAAMAHVRLGEISEILDKNVTSAKQHYLTAIDRFPFSLGEKLAQVRIARIEFFANKDPDFQISLLRKNVLSHGLPQQVKEMSSIQLIRYLNRNGHPEEAIRIAEDGVARSEGENYKIFKSIYIETLLLNVDAFIAQGKYAEALGFYESNKSWLDQGEPQIWLLLAKAYKKLRLYNTSSTFMGRYIEAQKRLNSGRIPSSFAKTRDDALYVKARLLFLQGQYRHAIDNLAGNDSLEAKHLRMQSYMKLGDLPPALKIAKQIQPKLGKMPKKLGASLIDQIQIDTAEVLLKNLKRRKEYKRQIELIQLVNKGLSKPYERFEFMLGDLYWYRQEFTKSIPAHKAALQKFPNSSRADRANYRLGLAYSSIGDRKNAVKTLTPVAQNSQNIWGQSARQELNLLQWEEKYSVILGDLPPSGLGIEL